MEGETRDEDEVINGDRGERYSYTDRDRLERSK